MKKQTKFRINDIRGARRLLTKFLNGIYFDNLENEKAKLLNSYLNSIIRSFEVESKIKVENKLTDDNYIRISKADLEKHKDILI